VVYIFKKHYILYVDNKILTPLQAEQGKV